MSNLLKGLELKPLCPERLAKLKDIQKKIAPLPVIEPSEGSVEVKSIKELDKSKIYHVAIDSKNTHPAGLRMFAEAAKALDLKMLITIGETTVETLQKTLDGLPVEQKHTILLLLGYNPPFNPLDHEQTK